MQWSKAGENGGRKLKIDYYLL